MDIGDLIKAIDSGQVRITDHADEEAKDDSLKFDEIYFSVHNGEVIEAYPQDNPYPSVLVYGRTFGGDPVHSVWAYNDMNGWAVLITAYRPDPDRWVSWRERRKNANDAI